MPRNSFITDAARDEADAWPPAEGSDARKSSAERIDWRHCEISSVEPGNETRAPAPADDAGPRPAEAVPTAQPANDMADAIIDRLVIDDSDPFFVATTDGFILRTNAAYDEMSRLSGGLLPEGPNSGRNGTAEVSAPMLAAFEEAELLRRVASFDETVMLGHEERCLKARYLPVFGDEGAVIAIVATFRDVTAQQKQLEAVNEAQNRFRDFARSTSDWFWEVDRAFRVTTLTERFTALTGEPAVRALGRRLDELGRFKSQPGDEGGLYQAMKRRVSFRDELLEIDTADGDVRQFHVSGVPIFDRASGEFSGYRGAGMDVTQRLRQEAESARIRADLEQALGKLTLQNEELDVASARAESALKAKNEFLASMSHELRTPLNAIIGFAEAMSVQVFGPLNDQYRGYSSDIMNSGQHLLGLIEDILDVAVMETGELSLSPEDVSLQSLLDRARALSVYRAENKNLDLSGLQVETDVVVHVDPRRATQIFANLLVNALKFTPDGGRVGFDVATTREGKVLVTVFDDGIGIPADKHEAIFEKFGQVNDNVYERSIEGSGLGLHISRELARRMGGKLTVISAPGKGSRFTVELPVVASPPVQFPVRNQAG